MRYFGRSRPWLSSVMRRTTTGWRAAVARHARSRPGDDLRLEPGRLRHELPVLRDRPGRPDPQPVDRRDRRAGRRRRRERWHAVRSLVAPAGFPTSSSWAWASRWRTTTRCSAPSAVLPTPPLTGWALSQRGITVSTVGLVPAIDKLTAEGLNVTLAVSLHAPDDELRDTLVPINTRWKVAEVLDAAARYVDGDQAAGLDRVRADSRHQRPGLAGRPAGSAAAGAARPPRAREPDSAEPDARIEVDGVARQGREGVRSRAGEPGRRGDGSRHARPRDRWCVRSARDRDAAIRIAVARRCVMTQRGPLPTERRVDRANQEGAVHADEISTGYDEDAVDGLLDDGHGGLASSSTAPSSLRRGFGPRCCPAPASPAATGQSMSTHLETLLQTLSTRCRVHKWRAQILCRRARTPSGKLRWRDRPRRALLRTDVRTSLLALLLLLVSWSLVLRFFWSALSGADGATTAMERLARGALGLGLAVVASVLTRVAWLYVRRPLSCG